MAETDGDDLIRQQRAAVLAPTTRPRAADAARLLDGLRERVERAQAAHRYAVWALGSCGLAVVLTATAALTR